MDHYFAEFRLKDKKKYGLCCLLLHLVQKDKLLCSSNVKAMPRCLFLLGDGGGGNMRRRQNLEINERHFARFNFSRLSLAFILNSSLILGNIFF